MKLCFALLCAMFFTVGAWGAPPPLGRQHIVKLKNLFVQPNASAPAPIKDVVASLGGRVDSEWRDRLVITVPDAALQVLRQHGAVKYIQRVVRGPFVATGTTSLDAPSMGEKAARIPIPNSSPPWDSGTYGYDGAGNIWAIGSDRFVYDLVSRLKISSVKGKPETYDYDAFGNLTSKTTNGAPPVSLSANPQTNHLEGKNYDTAGNLTGDTAQTYAYDPFSMTRQKNVSFTGATEYYVYDASDERIGVIRNPCSEPPQYCPEALTIWSLRDESGRVLRQYDVPYQDFFFSAWLWVEDYVYRDNVLLGGERQAEEGGRRHFHVDHLGTPRLVTGQPPSGQTAPMIAEHDYYPFGVEISPPGIGQETARGFDREEPMKFTGHMRDFNVGTAFENVNYDDHMHARNTVPNWGRFLSVDSHPADLANPQSWNRYVYALNNPVNLIDPDGRSAQLAMGEYYRMKMAQQSMSPGEFQEYQSLRAKAVAGLIVGAVIALNAPEMISFAMTTFLSNPIGITNTIGTALLPGPGGEMPVAQFERAATQLARNIRYTDTAATSLSIAGREIPTHTIAQAVLSGTRGADPQGAKGAIQITQSIWKYAQRLDPATGQMRWVQVQYRLRIIYNEAEKLVMHANIESIP